MIEEGHAIVRACIRGDQPGPFQLQAASQAVHCDADSFEATDWHQIVALYDHLFSVMPTPVVALNRAIALGEIEGPGAALSSARRNRTRPRQLSPDARSPWHNVATCWTTRRSQCRLRTRSPPRSDGSGPAVSRATDRRVGRGRVHAAPAGRIDRTIKPNKCALIAPAMLRSQPPISTRES